MHWAGSGVGHYLVLASLASLVAALVAEAVIHFRRVGSPALQSQYRRLALLLPPVAPLIYEILDLAPSLSRFRRASALLDTAPWLGVTFFAGAGLEHLFLAALGITTLVFLVREAAPALQNLLSPPSAALPDVEEGMLPRLDAALGPAQRWCRVRLARSPEPVLYCAGRNGLVVSPATVDALDDEELAAVLAHEQAHLAGKALWWDRATMLCRFSAFYSPVALYVSRRLADDTEKCCDDVAASLTGRPLALGSALLKLSQRPGDGAAVMAGAGRLENQARRDLLEERVRRLAGRSAGPAPGHRSWHVALTAGLLLALLYFVV